MILPIQTIAGIRYRLSPFSYWKIPGGPTLLTASSEYLACYHLSISLKGSNIIEQKKELESFRSTYLKFGRSYIPHIVEALWDGRWEKITYQRDNPIPYLVTVVKNMSIKEFKRYQSIFEIKKQIECPFCYEKQSAKNKLCKKCGAYLDEIDGKNFFKSLNKPVSPDKDPLMRFISDGGKTREEIQNELIELIDLKKKCIEANLNPFAVPAFLISRKYDIPFSRAYQILSLPESKYEAAKKDLQRKSHLFR